jgi:hypothetical protein
MTPSKERRKRNDTEEEGDIKGEALERLFLCDSVPNRTE